MRVLTVNSGSSTLKLALIGPDDRLEASLDIDPWDGSIEPEGLDAWLADLPPVDAVGHRIVHGGERFTGPTPLDDEVTEAVAALTSLAPLHQPRALLAIDAVGTALPGVASVACFDTAFHAGLPEAAATYALPAAWRRRWPLRRYGFHGLSHAWAARRAAELIGRPIAELCIVTCHLGAGASLCAVRHGRSVDTTMGFTPLEGLVMATRSGSVDPGLVLWLLQHGGLGLDEVARGLEHEAGLAGIVGGTGDMRAVVAGVVRGDKTSCLGLAIYIHRLRREIAAMVPALDGLDAVVFTGGIGEHQPLVRAGAVDGLAFLGLAIDPDKNDPATADADVSGAESTVRTLVVTAREDLEVARQVRQVLT